MNSQQRNVNFCLDYENNLKNMLEFKEKNNNACKYFDVCNSRSMKFDQTIILADKYLLKPIGDEGNGYKCIDVETRRHYFCKILTSNIEVEDLIWAHQIAQDCSFINSIHQIYSYKKCFYFIFPRMYGNLHWYIRLKKKLNEIESKKIFIQISECIYYCHEKGIILRDLKLRKFIFADAYLTKIKLESLEGAEIISDSRFDVIKWNVAYPAYINPEIISSPLYQCHGKAGDVWSLGVMLYAMLTGRYPFYDVSTEKMFSKIRNGQFHLPNFLTFESKLLLKSLLRVEYNKRIKTSELIYHPWFKMKSSEIEGSYLEEQVVPQTVYCCDV